MSTHVITWANRHRTQQADQLVPWTSASTGVEKAQHSRLRVYNAANTLLAEKLDIDGETATVNSDYNGTLRFELWSHRDGLDSWDRNIWTAPNTPTGTGTTITAATWVPDDGVVIIDGGGA